MRIVIEIPDELLAATASSSSANDATGTTLAATTSDARSGGAAPDSARAMRRAQPQAGVAALPAGPAEQTPVAQAGVPIVAPAAEGAHDGGIHDGGAASI